MYKLSCMRIEFSDFLHDLQVLWNFKRVFPGRDLTKRLDTSAP